MNFLSAALLGFLLGLKHATDADHVVAVTTFVSRERSFRRAAVIGGLWGIGHSLTVFLVGGALVVFRLVIPPRMGLGFEFGVALMLILLGFNNLRPANATEPHPHEHIALAWAKPAELLAYDLAAADLPVVKTYSTLPR